MGEIESFPWGPVLVTILPAIILSRMVWVYAVKRWLDGIVSRDEMERRFAEEREKILSEVRKIAMEQRHQTIEMIQSIQLRRRNP